MKALTLGELMDAKVHVGHQSSRWNPKNFQYIYTKQNGKHVIDLLQTCVLLDRAYNYVQAASKKNKTCLFIGTKSQASAIIAEEAKRCGAYYVNNRWLGGLLTNWSTMRSRVRYLNELDQREENGEIGRLPKKEGARLRREHEKLIHNLGGLRKMEQIPDFVIIIDTKRESTAVAECRKLKIPIISILDTNCDPDVIDVPIPANDDTASSIKLIISILADGICKNV